MQNSNNSVTGEMQANLVIIGGGGGGLTAAVEAAQQGVSNIVVLEKRDVTGGNAVWPESMVGGPFDPDSPGPPGGPPGGPQAPPMDFQSRLEDMFVKAMDYAHWRTDARLIRTLIEKSAETSKWLQAMGLKQFESGKTIGIVVKTLAEKCKEMNIPVLLNTRATKLLTDEQGKITGVLAEGPDKALRLEAKAVIISTGGFIGNKELMKRYFHSYDENIYEDMVILGIPHTGDGILMAEAVGAAMDNTVAFEFELNRFPWLPEGEPLVAVVDNNANNTPIWINKNGERFADESIPDSTNSLYRQYRKTSYTLFDEKIKQSIYRGRTRPFIERDYGKTWYLKAEEQMQEQVAEGRIKIADTWEEIAGFIGARPETLKATIAEYNAACARGKDDLFGKDPKSLVPLTEPPFYAIKCALAMQVTRGPLKVNRYMQVVNKSHDPIPGLYAAGVDIGGTDSETYSGKVLPWHSFAFTISSGRIAAENAAGYIAEE